MKFKLPSDEICPECSKLGKEHTSEEVQNCLKKLIEFGIMRYCGLCGVTKPAKGVHDRCGNCGEKYTFSNA